MKSIFFFSQKRICARARHVTKKRRYKIIFFDIFALFPTSTSVELRGPMSMCAHIRTDILNNIIHKHQSETEISAIEATKTLNNIVLKIDIRTSRCVSCYHTLPCPHRRHWCTHGRDQQQWHGWRCRAFCQ